MEIPLAALGLVSKIYHGGIKQPRFFSTRKWDYRDLLLLNSGEQGRKRIFCRFLYFMVSLPFLSGLLVLIFFFFLNKGCSAW